MSNSLLGTASVRRENSLCVTYGLEGVCIDPRTVLSATCDLSWCVCCSSDSHLQVMFFLSVGRLFETFVWDHRRCAPMMLCCLAARSARHPGRFLKVLQKPLRLLLADPPGVGVCVCVWGSLIDLERNNPLPLSLIHI